MYHLTHIKKQEFLDLGEGEVKLRMPKDINLSGLLTQGMKPRKVGNSARFSSLLFYMSTYFPSATGRLGFAWREPTSPLLGNI